MKKFMGMVFAGMFLIGILACTEATPYEAYVTVDINPSVGFVVNEQNIVQAAHALNQDAETLLLELNLNGKSLDEVIDQVIDEAMNLGFIDVLAEQTTIEIDAIGNTDAISERVRQLVQDKLQTKMSDRALNAIVQAKNYDSAFAAQASEHGVSPAQFRLMKETMNLESELSDDEIGELDPEGMIERIRANTQVAAGITRELVDEFKAAKDVIHAAYLPQIEALNTQIEAATEAGEDTAELEAQLQTLKDAMIAELQVVISGFITQSQTIKEQVMTEWTNRVQENADKVTQYRSGLPTGQTGSITTRVTSNRTTTSITQGGSN